MAAWMPASRIEYEQKTQRVIPVIVLTPTTTG
jgi:hypothetical protein